MADNETPYSKMKAFSGLIHRQPIFVTNKLDVDSYHLTFLDSNGQKLNDDSEVPEFVLQIPQILPEISHRQKALLTIPESWRDALLETSNHGLSLTIDINGDNIPTALTHQPFAFASHAHLTGADSRTQTLLIDMQEITADSLLHKLPVWRNNHDFLCATNVNEANQFKFCKSHELDLLQGFFYTLPEAKDKQKITPSAQTLMELLVKLQDQEAEPEDLADIINQDVSLSYKLLRLINSAFFGLPREVSSTKQAVMMLGLNKVKTWASLLCLTGMDDKPNELRSVAMVRARMCELLAKYYHGQAEVFFSVGLFSTLDALMDKPMSGIIADLPLAPEITEALLNKQGAAGQALQDVLAYERGDWQTLENSSLPGEVLVRIYLDSIQWAKELNLQLGD